MCTYRKLESRWRPHLVSIVLAALALGPSGRAENPTALEYQVKAGFLFNFAKFIEWPPEKFPQSDSPLIIGVVGADPFGGILEEAVGDKTINNRRMVVKHVPIGDELKKCHLLFISGSEKDRLGAILAEVKGSNVLTVGETDKFLSRNGIINFVMVDNKVRFEINEAAASHAGLKISSKLLALAQSVK